jgi:6-phosphogluconolactonase
VSSNIETKRCILEIFRLFTINEYFNIAISGGKTPIDLFIFSSKFFRIHKKKYQAQLKKVNIFWVDERPYAHTHPDSNVGTFFKYFTNENINYYTINGASKDLKSEALNYQNVIKKNVKIVNSIPQFDLILLGIGDDGHIASLFPNTKSLKEKKKLFTTNYIPKLRQYRLTMTFTLLLNAKNVFIIYAGNSKTKMIKDNHNKKPTLPYKIFEINFENNLQFIKLSN